MRRERATSYPVQIFICGDYHKAQEICRKFCDEFGECVTVQRAEYIYRGGQESGLVVGLINYPRFPREPWRIEERAFLLATVLRIELGQESFSIQYRDDTIWYSWRAEDNPL